MNERMDFAVPHSAKVGQIISIRSIDYAAPWWKRLWHKLLRKGPVYKDEMVKVTSVSKYTIHFTPL